MRWIVLLVALIIIGIAIADPRLPEQGADDDGWGTLLNEFLLVTLNETGGLRNNIVTTQHLANGSVTGSIIALESVDGAHIMDDAIGSNHIIDASIGESELDIGSVSTDHIIDGTIEWEDLNSGSVDSGTIIDGSIEGLDIAPDAITSEHIQNLSIAAGDIATDAVTSSQIMDSTIRGNDIATDASITVASLEANEISSNLFYTGVHVVINACNNCTAEATCEEGYILYGMKSTTSSECHTNPSACTAYCTPGTTTCTATGAVASVYIVCARIV